ncbi:MAG: hypothetical protein A2508_09100 [Candidatus Lambdaproteobacteria bacterium RIFOXYD12_FULL_49_8]|uniref:Basal-body rod modification protein FlgD n=1 Tax=Candidatus Lambdaproteobacteria bacterium RIFOXYD2_FULL_50_16 TaxID=1817772 RepID=A0A1F6GB75_9PROT|nr:MAG: hypothetical protein A2527_07525 [Candidatus Lambdaproteobacteria bacterium RIFOXYD2_FULL_50_16]OGG97572.1 MAG: hypothetical protein A2508_09100 [Candidatus Lambdaproteobacteria bacterium RIFOXYD12_FULL_49_8]
MSLETTRATLNQSASSLRSEAIHSSKGNANLGKKDFMNLFLTQMSNQNPTDPMDSAGMTTQLAQLGSMEQLENLNKGLDTLNQTQSSIANYQALQFIGKDVALESSEMELSRGAGQPIYYNLDSDASQLKLTVEAQDGSPVYSENMGLTTQGKHRFVWDGKNDRGILMADGVYKVKLSATLPNGEVAELTPYNSGRISQVEFKDGQAFVNAQGRQLPLSKVKRVDNASERVFSKAAPLGLMRELTPMAPAKKAE